MTYQETYEQWLRSPVLTQEEREELSAISGDEEEKESRFYANLAFGTAGLRGVMGMGTNRMNVYVVRRTTQAFAQVILDAGEEAVRRGIAIDYDCRNGSERFAREAACVMAANGIPVLLFDALRPTPELSFAIRHYGCTAGINITASHNTKEYNGYKVYWSDGAQLPPAQADAIARYVEKIDIFTGVKTMEYGKALADGCIRLLGAETDEAFLHEVMGQVCDPQAVPRVADTFQVIFTPFHGCGRILIPEALRRLGVKHLVCVPEQMVADGNFPTVESPNPENPEGFYLAVELAKKHGADFILGSDPDADRVGIMVRDRNGEFVTVTGNQTGVLMLDYLIRARRRAGTLPQNAAFIRSIVTTEMGKAVAEANGVGAYEGFTGFKYLAEKKNALEASGEAKVIMAYEESYGYMLGDYVRDKDAVTASLILTEMAAWYAGQGMTLLDALEACYERYGWFAEKTYNLVMPGLSGVAKRRELMASLRSDPVAEIAGEPVALRRDYIDGSEYDVKTGGIRRMELRDSDVLSYVLRDGTTVVVRPSGTEPKIKVYLMARGADREDCAEKLRRYGEWAQALRDRV